MSRLRIAVVGTGHLGRIHARIASSLDDARLVAVVDTSPQARNQVAGELATTALADYRDLFGVADAAVIATPTGHHFEVARELLLGGIHVLVEKPITTTLEQADELVRLAKRQQLVLQVGHIERFNPALTAVRAKLESPKYIQTRRLSPYTFRSTDIGVVLDLMIHDIDVVLNLVNSPVSRIEATGLSVMGNEEDVVEARLHFASGCIASLVASRVSFESVRSMQVFTEECFARVDFGQRQATLIEPSQEILSRQFHVDTLLPEQKERLREKMFEELLVRSELPISEVNAIEEEQLDFVRAIRTDGIPQVTGSDGRDALAIAQGILEQVQSHAWDGENTSRRGPYAMPQLASVLEVEDQWSLEDTVVIRRKAG